MIKVSNPKIKDVFQGMHEALLRKVKRGSQVKDDIVMEGRLFSIICTDFDMGPTKCAIEMNDRYGYDLTGDEVIQIFRNRRMAHPVERKELLQWADSVADAFARAIDGRKEDFEVYEELRKQPALKCGKKHDSQDRMAAIMIYSKYPEVDLYDDSNSLLLLGNTLARYYFYDISDVICEVYGFPLYREKKNQQVQTKIELKLTYEQALRRVEYLENSLERTNTLLQDLQEEFDEQLEASKVKELAEFFTKLNSERYGCILDELLVLKKGMEELRKSNYELPIEINGLLIMVKKLIQFVRDSHIDPIMKVDSIKEVVASDVEFCNYEGTPFVSKEDVKTVKVVSLGWIYKDKEVQISRPKVKEV